MERLRRPTEALRSRCGRNEQLAGADEAVRALELAKGLLDLVPGGGVLGLGQARTGADAETATGLSAKPSGRNGVFETSDLTTCGHGLVGYIALSAVHDRA